MSWFKLWSKGGYTSVPAHEEVDALLPTGKHGEGYAPLSSPAGAAKQSRTSTTSILILAVCLVCTITNAIMLSRVGMPAGGEKQLDKFSHLPRPNPFPNFDSINRTGADIAKLEPLLNWPAVLTQVNSSDKAYVYPQDVARVLTTLGTVSPEERKFQVNNEVHSIAQFRARDFGMEDCHLVVNIPPLKDQSKVIGLMNYTVTMSSETLSVDLWRLAPTTPGLIRPSKLSWNSRPPRLDTSPFDTLTIKRGEAVESFHFPCPRDSVHTFEFACAGDANCNLEFWQNGWQDILGVYMRQHATV